MSIFGAVMEVLFWVGAGPISMGICMLIIMSVCKIVWCRSWAELDLYAELKNPGTSFWEEYKKIYKVCFTIGLICWGIDLFLLFIAFVYTAFMSILYK